MSRFSFDGNNTTICKNPGEKCVRCIQNSYFLTDDPTLFFSEAEVLGNDFGASSVAFVSGLSRLVYSFPMFAGLGV